MLGEMRAGVLQAAQRARSVVALLSPVRQRMAARKALGMMYMGRSKVERKALMEAAEEAADQSGTTTPRLSAAYVRLLTGRGGAVGQAEAQECAAASSWLAEVHPQGPASTGPAEQRRKYISPEEEDKGTQGPSLQGQGSSLPGPRRRPRRRHSERKTQERAERRHRLRSLVRAASGVLRLRKVGGCVGQWRKAHRAAEVAGAPRPVRWRRTLLLEAEERAEQRHRLLRAASGRLLNTKVGGCVERWRKAAREARTMKTLEVLQREAVRRAVLTARPKSQRALTARGRKQAKRKVERAKELLQQEGTRGAVAAWRTRVEAAGRGELRVATTRGEGAEAPQAFNTSGLGPSRARQSKGGDSPDPVEEGVSPGLY